MKEQLLTTKISQKKFSSVISGYSPSEVDKFLDEISLYIEEMTNKNLALENENKILKNKVKGKV